MPNKSASLHIPQDLAFLKYLQTPHNRYEIRVHFKKNYSIIHEQAERLLKLGFIFVVREEDGRGPSTVKYYSLTMKGQAYLRASEEE